MAPSINESLNCQLDLLVRPSISFKGKCISPFQIWGSVGIILALILTASLVTSLGLSLQILGRLILAATVTFLGVALEGKRL